MIVSLSGIDGVGKTTQARYVTEILQVEGLEVKYIHIIPWTLVNRLGRLMKRDKRQQVQGDEAPRENRVFSLTRQLISILDVLRFRMLCIYQSRIRSRVIVCDRFFYDLGVQAIYMGSMNSKFERFYWQLVPSPTISIILDVSPEIAYQRDGEHELVYYQIKRKFYLERTLLWGAILVDAIELEKTRQDIKQILLNSLENSFA